MRVALGRERLRASNHRPQFRGIESVATDTRATHLIYQCRRHAAGGLVYGTPRLGGPQPTIMFIHAGPYMAVGSVFRFDFWMLCSTRLRGALRETSVDQWDMGDRFPLQSTRIGVSRFLGPYGRSPTRRLRKDLADKDRLRCLGRFAWRLCNGLDYRSHKPLPCRRCGSLHH